LPPRQSSPTDADIIARITDQVQQDYGVKPKPGNVPSPPEVRMTKQIVILGNQLTRLEKIVATQAVKTDNFFKLITSKPSAPTKADQSAVYWVAGGVLLLMVLFGVVLFLSAIVFAIVNKLRG